VSLREGAEAMKKFLLAGVVIISASTAAMAADLAVPVDPVYDWTGFYLGLNAGVAWNNSDVDFDGGGLAVGLVDGIEGDQTEFTGGVEAGYNWQMDSIVFGLEADFNYLGFDESEDFVLGAATASVDFKADWFGTVRGRIGFAADNFLFYGTGGLAYGHAKIEGDLDDGAGNTLSGDDSSVNWGWTIGAGMQYAFNENWILGAEYLYVDLGHPDLDVDCIGGGCGAFVDNSDVDAAFSVVRAKLDFKF
jgi:outer membrane immunogenic protein